ncbi:hypothetical protein G6F31_015965 [Rhizopus arrhizus]|nr:hypothetical protein G6F31_015965 [Rhizopus arrhizus]
MGAELGFSAGEIEAVDLHGARISSTRIRQLLQDGDFARAGDLLGRPYAISGRVVRGRQLGRTLGFPTANLRFPKTPALSGIYATWVHGVFDQPWPSVSSFGTRPTVDGVEPLLEAHLFDFQGDLRAPSFPNIDCEPLREPGLQDHPEPATHRIPDARRPAQARAGHSGAVGSAGALPAAARQRRRPPAVRAARRPAVRQRPHPPRPCGQQDPEGHHRQVALPGRLRCTLRAGLGLPRPADRDRGREEVGQGRHHARRG